MEKIISQETGIPEEKKPGAFNFNKLQAVLCMVASAVVSIALIAWAAKAFF